MLKKEFYITTNQDSRLSKESENSQISRAEIVRTALDEYFKKIDKQKLKELRTKGEQG